VDAVANAANEIARQLALRTANGKGMRYVVIKREAAEIVLQELDFQLARAGYHDNPHQRD
jgi:hypothetical protein